MVLEVAFFNIKEGLEADFERSFEEAGAIISQVEGYLSHTMHACIETKGKYMVQVEWETLESHMIGFVESTLFEQFNEKVGHYFKPDVYMEHFKLVQPKKG
ncbi:antibiotic biosynthesis monooxygenase family protein [Pseudalkalibacillus berkeleyi]|uniref:Antibiotic biosynthesis monooxygenase n=1 Tax=Pseudalkalibacillus berkeleyi TaxID=1069813 RepID=A0ABS9H262_9BACL|nr:antibiotic biosynthesis monooxygenase family protein [Pseudalkalibacillus berkeleyi]MCF6139052.1 antibiotic biosynthesis monooxygenase [Pseudalkalibacillus berkeleyi]